MAKRRQKGRSGWLEHSARVVTVWTGSSLAFGCAVGVLIIWALLGPIFHFSDTWQLVINTGTTIVTFLMVFLIQRSQNKDSLAIHLKLNEIVAVLRAALMGFGEATECAALRDSLCLHGFAPVSVADYDVMANWDQEARAAGFALPT